jgi:MarR family transcriptional regulator, lower aerobic nicotinate degradation pathway regulator
MIRDDQARQRLLGATAAGNRTPVEPPVAVDAKAAIFQRAAAYRLCDQIGTILRVANQNAIDVFNKCIQEAFAEDAVTTTQFAVLAMLWRFGAMSHSALADKTVVDMPTLHNLLQRMANKGLVKTKVDAADKRRRIVSLTPAGVELALRLRAMGTTISDRILDPLTKQEQAQLVMLLKKLNAPRRSPAEE